MAHTKSNFSMSKTVHNAAGAFIRCTDRLSVILLTIRFPDQAGAVFVSALRRSHAPGATHAEWLNATVRWAHRCVQTLDSVAWRCQGGKGSMLLDATSTLPSHEWAHTIAQPSHTLPIICHDHNDELRAPRSLSNY